MVVLTGAAWANVIVIIAQRVAAMTIGTRIVAKCRDPLRRMLISSDVGAAGKTA